MSIIYLIGRAAFVAIFLVSGIFNLMDREKAAALIQSKFTFPAGLANAVGRAEAATGLTGYQLLAIGVSVIEIVFALLIIFNVVTRFSAFVLFVFVAVATFYLYDFWDMAGDARSLAMTLALQNLSIMGGLLILMVLGPWRPGGSFEDDDYTV